jgi:hypothetical protein
MRIRTIKPELFTNPVVSSWPADVFKTLTGLYCYLDDDGRGVDDVRLVKAAVYPLVDKITPKVLTQHLELMAVPPGPRCRYQADDGTNVMHIIEWKVKGSDFYQQINKPGKSRIQPCPKHDEPTLFT